VLTWLQGEGHVTKWEYHNNEKFIETENITSKRKLASYQVESRKLLIVLCRQ